MSENIFRKEYRPLTDHEKALLDRLKDVAQELHDIYSDAATPNNARHIAIAKTELETSVMYAVKAITT